MTQGSPSRYRTTTQLQSWGACRTGLAGSIRDLNALGKPGSARCVQLVTGVFWGDIDARELRLE